MPNYGYSSGTATGRPTSPSDLVPLTRSGKVPSGPSKPITVKGSSKLVVKNGRLVVQTKGNT